MRSFIKTIAILGALAFCALACGGKKIPMIGDRPVDITPEQAADDALSNPKTVAGTPEDLGEAVEPTPEPSEVPTPPLAGD